MTTHDESDYITDDYQHLTPGIFYAVTRVPGKDAPEDLFEKFENGCDCTDICTAENNCTCLKFGQNYSKTENNLTLQENKFGNSPVIECNFQCQCFHKNCSNRCVQFGPLKHLKIFQTDSKGLGLKTEKEISSGTFICEYAGEVIGLEEAKERQMKNKSEKKMNYIFILNEHFENKDLVTCVDPSVIGNIGRYINHSCEPNSAVVPVRVNDPVPWLCIFATRDIKANEEICYDYSGCFKDVESDKDVKERVPCLCGAQTCKKWLPYDVNI